MARVVPDTNILVSAVIGRGKPREFLRRCLAGEFTLVTSPTLLEEFADVMRRPKFRVTEEELTRIVVSLLGAAVVVEPTSQIRAVRDDPDDDAVLAAAVDGKADVIVSGDDHLLSLGEFRGIPIIRVAALLDPGGMPFPRD